MMALHSPLNKFEFFSQKKYFWEMLKIPTTELNKIMNSVDFTTDIDLFNFCITLCYHQTLKDYFVSFRLWKILYVQK